MKLKTVGCGIVLAVVAFGLLGCTSEASRERQRQAEARRKVAQEDQELQAQEGADEGQRALVLKEQERLDGVEQKRTGNVYAHSCRKVTAVNYLLNATSLDTNHCSAEQLKLEQAAEQQQNRDKVMGDVVQRMNDQRQKMEGMMKPVGSSGNQ